MVVTHGDILVVTAEVTLNGCDIMDGSINADILETECEIMALIY